MAKTLDDMKTPDPLNEVASGDGVAGALEAQDIHHDAVFGEVTEEGPNYRNVSVSSFSLLMLIRAATYNLVAGMDRNGGRDVEASDWPGRAVASLGLRYHRTDSRHHLAYRGFRHRHVD